MINDTIMHNQGMKNTLLCIMGYHLVSSGDAVLLWSSNKCNSVTGSLAIFFVRSRKIQWKSSFEVHHKSATKNFSHFWADSNNGISIYWNRWLISENHPVQPHGFSFRCTRLTGCFWHLPDHSDNSSEGTYRNVHLHFVGSHLSECCFPGRFQGSLTV